MTTLSSLRFHHRFTEALPEAFYAFLKPTPVSAPSLAAWSQDAAEMFSLARPSPRGEDVDVLTGNRLLPGMKPFATCYGGHQFGHWAGQLGDGRALILGEVADRDGKLWELQLKGAGPTPYSRRADGRAVLRSSIREFIASEAMFHLGVPTTRALSLTTTGEGVLRDLLYDGHPRLEPGAVITRLSPSFVRFGHFEIFASRGESEHLRLLAEHVLRTQFPEFFPGTPENLSAWFREVCRRTAWMLAHWMRVGFVHGVMNTDNMSILGLTLDYGPFGWLDDYAPSWTPNTTDLPGRRYCYGRQPLVAQWNLAQLGRALSPLLPDEGASLPFALEEFEHVYSDYFREMHAAKLGLRDLDGEGGLRLLREMDELLRATETDMTLFFRGLSELDSSSEVRELPSFLLDAQYSTPPGEDLTRRWLGWFEALSHRVREEALCTEERHRRMREANPAYVPRNYLLQLAIESAEAGDFKPVEELLDVLRKPYELQPGREAFARKRPDWARNKAGCSMLSCSS